MRWATVAAPALASPGYLVTASVLMLMLTLTRRGAVAGQARRSKADRWESGGGEGV